MQLLSETPSSIAVTFETRSGGPARLLADAELHFAGGVFDGMKLVGFTVWQSAEGDVYVTFPSRSWGAGSERRYFDFLRSATANAEQVRTVKTEIARAYNTWSRARTERQA